MMAVQPNGVSHSEEGNARTPSKLILCFDGTGNKYQGKPSDTNIVKLYQKFDREAPHQYHYYQPGIGTYSAEAGSLNRWGWARFKQWTSQILDQGYGTTFDQHVIAGYRFIMRYYGPGDKIYIFGFSRGAFTARFLARMISTVGLLSMGNEEMVAFAYKAYQDSETSQRDKTRAEHDAFLTNFKETFCRSGVDIHFLGLFDTVNSVGVFDVPFAKSTELPSVLKTATHVRHAVSIDERRAKFKAALLNQDKKADKHKDNEEDIKEVFFPGNHGDVGGGWNPEPEKSKSPKAATYAPDPKDRLDLSDPHQLREFGIPDSLSKDAVAELQHEADDPVQLSDFALEWMITELEKLGNRKGASPTETISWNYHRNIFKHNLYSKVREAVTAKKHDLLSLGGGGSFFKLVLWHIMEWLPFKKLELENRRWKSDRSPNRGGTRDIPDGSVFHPAIRTRMQLLRQPSYDVPYRPSNDGSDKKPFVLLDNWENKKDVIYERLRAIEEEDKRV